MLRQYGSMSSIRSTHGAATHSASENAPPSRKGAAPVDASRQPPRAIVRSHRDASTARSVSRRPATAVRTCVSDSALSTV